MNTLDNMSIRETIAELFPSLDELKDYEQWLGLFDEIDARLFANKKAGPICIAAVNDSSQTFSAANAFAALGAIYACFYPEKKVAVIAEVAEPEAEQACLISDLHAKPESVVDLDDYYWRDKTWRACLSSTKLSNLQVLHRTVLPGLNKIHFEKVSAMLADMQKKYDVVLHAGLSLQSFNSAVCVSEMMGHTVLFIESGSPEIQLVSKFSNVAKANDFEIIGSVLYKVEHPFPQALFENM